MSCRASILRRPAAPSLARELGLIEQRVNGAGEFGGVGILDQNSAACIQNFGNGAYLGRDYRSRAGQGLENHERHAFAARWKNHEIGWRRIAARDRPPSRENRRCFRARVYGRAASKACRSGPVARDDEPEIALRTELRQLVRDIGDQQRPLHRIEPRGKQNGFYGIVAQRRGLKSLQVDAVADQHDLRVGRPGVQQSIANCLRHRDARVDQGGHFGGGCNLVPGFVHGVNDVDDLDLGQDLLDVWNGRVSVEAVLDDARYRSASSRSRSRGQRPSSPAGLPRRDRRCDPRAAAILQASGRRANGWPTAESRNVWNVASPRCRRAPIRRRPARGEE